jgi:putative Holliday junction resolvase
MGLDVGDRRIGVAVSDPLALFARPLTTVERADDAVAIRAIVELAGELGVVRLIVGLPLLPSGDRGEQALRTEAFVRQLRDVTDLPIELHDESYSTQDASARLRAAGHGVDGHRGRVDAAAAAIIIEAWLSENGPPPLPPLEDDE